MKKLALLLSLSFLILTLDACISKKEIVDVPLKEVYFDDIEIVPEEEPAYNPSRTLINDLIHTKLEVSFDWDSSFLYGKANLTFTPYFYSTSELVLDAKGFQLHEVAIVDALGNKKNLEYCYDNLQITIDLNETFHRTDTYEVFIDYTAMPNKLENSSSRAITDDKGLYFINPDESEKDKPRQVWTQGEPESNSCWFPTIDSPNERTTQEIYITVEKEFKTLSNGELMFQIENSDGTRTDYWKQDLPHAPYLFMLAAGDFAEVEDTWRDIPVHYFVEPEYEDIAKDIYPYTVEMLEFFSTLLNYDYPWDKFHQIVVRDYVSGAMENSGAVVYGEFIQGDKRFLIDNSGEDVVAHEMFHHWFGNLVTTESWANLPLNEAFATYGEYLWREHKYGKDDADHYGFNDLRYYIQMGKNSKKNLIRYDYKHMNDMFDVNTYQKGGRVLHMLRSYVGDDAFFTALNLYLKENEYQAVEVHNLRLAFEKVTGEDLNWFFNQWFLGAGHPNLKIRSNYIDSLKILELNIEQTQEHEDVPHLFKVPTTVQIVNAKGESEIKTIVIDERYHTFNFDYEEAPILVNFDADKSLIAEVDQRFTLEEAAVLYRKGENYRDRYNAINVLKRGSDSLSNQIKKEALQDEFWHIRELAIEGINSLVREDSYGIQQQLTFMALKDPKSDVRAKAIKALTKYYKNETEFSTYHKLIEDSSYVVVAASIKSLYEKDVQEGLKVAKKIEGLKSNLVAIELATIYAEDGAAEHFDFFKTKIKGISGFDSYTLSSLLGDYLESQDVEIIEEALPLLKAEAMKNNVAWWMRIGAVSSIIQLDSRFKAEMKEQGKKASEKIEITQSPTYEKSKRMSEKIQQTLREIKAQEKSENLIQVINVSLNN